MTMPGRSHHLLSIGATGMLADAVIALSADTTRVTSVARTERSLDELDRMLVAAHHANGSLPVRRSLALDYRQQTAFRRIAYE